jgi:lysozyme
MIDVENCGNWSRKQVQKAMKQLCDLVEKHYGCKPMIYSVQNTYNKYLAPEFNVYPLYIGRFGEEEPVIKGGGHYTVWQYTPKSMVKGIPLQADRCRLHHKATVSDFSL